MCLKISQTGKRKTKSYTIKNIFMSLPERELISKKLLKNSSTALPIEFQ